MTTTGEHLENPPEARIGESFDPPMSDEFATAALARAERLEAFLPGMSATQLAVVLLLAAVYLITSFYPLHHTDLWAHLAYGRAMVESGRLLVAEPFGIEAANQAFVNVPWLAQIVGFELYSVLGPAGLLFLHALLATAAVGFLLPAVRARRVSWPWAVAAAGVGYLLSSTVVGVIRPQLVGMVCLPLVLLAVGRIGRGRGPYFWLPPVVLLWANLHGSFVLGIFVLFAALADSLWNERRRGNSLAVAMKSETNRRLAMLTALCLIATLVNPLGPRLWLSVLGFSTQANLADIVEWRPLVVNSLGGMMFFATMLVTGLLLRFSPRRVRPLELLLLLVFGAATLLSMRMIAWYALIWPWAIAPHAMAACRAQWGRAGTTVNVDLKPMRTLIAVAALFLALVWAPASHAWLMSAPLAETQASDRETPILLAEGLAEHGIHGKVFVPMDWADYLIWQSRGDIRPLVYSHVHLIDANAWQDYRHIAAGSAGWLRLADRHELKYLIVRRSDPTSLMMWSHPRTVVRYQDQQSIALELLPPVEEKPTEEETTSKENE